MTPELVAPETVTVPPVSVMVVGNGSGPSVVVVPFKVSVTFVIARYEPGPL